MLSDARWAVLEPLTETCRPKGKTPAQDLRRPRSAILARHRNGAKRRAVPAERGPWWRAARVFVRWARLGVRERPLTLVQERGVSLGSVLLPRPDQRPRAPGGGRCGANGGSRAERDHRGALGRSRGGHGPKACAIADGQGRAVASRSAPGQAHALPRARRAAPPPAAGRAGAGRGRPRPLQPHLATARPGCGCATGDPPEGQRGGGRPPGVDPRQPRPGRAAPGPARGGARGRHPLPEDRRPLRRRPRPRCSARRAPAMTRLSTPLEPSPFAPK